MNRVASFAQLVVSLSVLILAGNGSTGQADESSKEFAAKLEELCRKYDIPAMTAAVVNASGLVQSQCFGIRKRGTTDKVELSDRFPIGSNTKSMTATLAAVLVESGKIDWDTTIGDVWPNARDKDIHPLLRRITLEQLLSHQSGLPANIADISWRSIHPRISQRLMRA